MIHITDKIYITYAESVLSPRDENRVAEAFIQVIDKNLAAISFPAYDSKKLLGCKNLEELLSEYESEQGLVDKCKEVIKSGRTPKIVIYADENAFTEFLCRWWKCLFPNLTVDGGYALYRLFGDSETLRNTNRSNFLSFTGLPVDGLFKNVMNTYWGKSKEEFAKVFGPAQAFELDEETKEECSIEFHLMNYILDPEYDRIHVLLNRIYRLYGKKLMKEIYYMKETIEEGLYALAASETLLTDNALLNDTSIEESVKKNAKLSFILDDKLVDSMAGFEHLKANYNIPKLAANLLNLDNQINKHVINNDKSVEVDNPCLDYLAKNRKDPYFIKLIQDECHGLGKSQFKLLDILIKKNRLNPYIVPAMQRSIQQGLPVVQEFKF